MKTQEFLVRLEKVKKTGKASWVACCPAHPDKTPSLSITEAPDRLLVYCFAGCTMPSIAEAVHMDIADFFAEDLSKSQLHRKAIQGRPDPASLVEAIGGELDVAFVVMSSVINCEGFTESDWERFKQAHGRIKRAISLLKGGYG